MLEAPSEWHTGQLKLTLNQCKLTLLCLSQVLDKHALLMCSDNGRKTISQRSSAHHARRWLEARGRSRGANEQVRAAQVGVNAAGF